MICIHRKVLIRKDTDNIKITELKGKREQPDRPNQYNPPPRISSRNVAKGI